MFELKKVETAPQSESKKEKVLIYPMFQKKINQVIEICETLDALEHDNSFTTENLFTSLVKETISLCNMAKRVCSDNGYRKAISKATASQVSCSFSKQNGLYRIRFDKLFPKRVTFLGNDADNIWQSYVMALQNTLFAEGITPFGERAVVVYMHHFANDESMIDYDNMDSKAILDALAVYFFKDDNPKHFAKYEDFTYSDNGTSFTEILIMSQSKFIEFFTNCH